MESVVMTAGQKIRVIVVEDHAIVREGIAYLLNSEPDITVVATASNGLEALKVIAMLYPQIDVILMDLQMPELDGVTTIRKLKEQYKNLKIIILTTFETDEYIFEGIRSGANGYLLKDVPKIELCRAIRVVNNGQAMVQSELTSRVFNLLGSGAYTSEIDKQRVIWDKHGGGTSIPNAPMTTQGATGEVRLTEREMEVLKLLAKGERNKEIAIRLGIAESTVKGYVSIIFQKFEVSDRTEAAMYAVQKGLIKFD